MPDSAVEEAYTGERHEENFSWFEACWIPNGGEESGRIQDEGY
jgi:hypothetical protein